MKKEVELCDFCAEGDLPPRVATRQCEVCGRWSCNIDNSSVFDHSVEPATQYLVDNPSAFPVNICRQCNASLSTLIKPSDRDNMNIGVAPLREAGAATIRAYLKKCMEELE